MPVRPPATCLACGAGKQQEVPACTGDAPHLLEKPPPGLCCRVVMPKDDARMRRQRPNGRQQRVAHPFVGHQPEPGQGPAMPGMGVAPKHCPPYRGAMIDEAKVRLDEVSDRIARAARLSGRDPATVTLVAVSKTWPAECIRPLIEAGHRHFGENRVQEAQAKWPALKQAFSGMAVHMVGQLQSNKADDAVALFDAIHSIDRASLIEALARAQDRAQRRPACFLQVNIGEEEQKGGCAVAALPSLLAQARSAGLCVFGLMAVPPVGVEPAPYFALLAKLARDLGLEGLSMGMTGDFETAIMLGATHVRIGSALFGART